MRENTRRVANAMSQAPATDSVTGLLRCVASKDLKVHSLTVRSSGLMCEQAFEVACILVRSRCAPLHSFSRQGEGIRKYSFSTFCRKRHGHGHEITKHMVTVTS